MKNSKKIDTIIFDVGNVLVQWDWPGYLNSFHFNPEKYACIAKATYLSSVIIERDKGILSDEAYISQSVSLAPQYEKEIREILEHDGRSIHLYPYAEPWIRHLKEAGYHLYILSNYPHLTFVQSVEQMPFLCYMDGSLFSYTVHHIKPDPEIYRILLTRYNLDPANCAYIDDRQDNADTAGSFGMHSILFQGYDDACQKLAKLGIC